MTNHHPAEQKSRFITKRFPARHLINALIILSAASLVMLPIFIQGFPRGSDIGFHFRWNYYFAEELRQGNLYPRWLAGANHGYGSPVTLYYPPLQFYVTGAINFLVRDTWRAITLACWLATALCGLSMYRFSRASLSRAFSLAAAAMYMWAPYHLLDLYRGSSLSQYWSAVWIPLVLGATHRVASESGWRAVAYLAFSYGLLCLTHVPVAFATTLLLPAYVVVLTRNPRHWLRVAAGLGLGLGISAIFMFSVVFERPYVTLDAALDQKFADCYVFEHLGQLRHVRLLANADYPGLEGYLIEIDLAAVALVLLLALSLLMIWRARNGSEQRRVWEPFVGASLAVVSLSLFFTTRASAFVVRHIPFIEYMQCADRWLVITVAGASLLFGAAACATLRARKRRVLKIGLLAAAVMLNLLIGIHITTQTRANPARLEDRVLQKPDAPQYTPVWWNREWQDNFESAAFVVNNGDATVTAIRDAGVRQQYALTASTESVVSFRPLYFPGWIARLDGKPTPITPGDEGHIQLVIPAGEHTLALAFEDTWPRTMGKIISAFSLLLCLVMIYRRRRQL